MPDWRPRLAAYVAQVSSRPFRPGRHDCALFAAGAVQAMTGADPAAAMRGTYRSLEDGKALLKAQGTPSLGALLEANLTEVPPAYAQAGDLALLREGDAEAMGVVQGERVYCLTPTGLALVERARMLRAFRL
ncbi:hypothetical protein FGK64_21960 [Arenibacterium halophilum]|uniref:DUF6950 domain-containing protein n=1 Tax=Arenibacterium halophilum TaxID=2583821 RepID=A0ABY2WX19_9RHOB|nr:hypothetical protein FGK64_21960 [Arenibacterium halophilum]